MTKRTTVVVDTNIILRLLLGDIKNQFETAKKVFVQIEEGTKAGSVSLLVLHELLWILEHYYEKSRSDFVPQLMQLLSIKYLKMMEVKKRDVMVILEPDFRKLVSW